MARRTARPVSGLTAKGDHNTIPRMPGWVTLSRGQSPEDVPFLSGAALATLLIAVARDDVPHVLWRDRPALGAAAACMAVAGRPERAGALRDAVHLRRPGDYPGPAGEICLNWQRVVEQPVSANALHRAMPGFTRKQMPRDWMRGRPL